MRSTARFQFDAFWEAKEARMAVDILLNPQSEARFEFQSLGIEETSPPTEGLYFNSASFAGSSITFSAKVFLTKTEDPDWQYRSTRFEALDVRRKVDDLEEYGADQATLSGLKLLIDPRNITMMAPGTG
jgi:hypothetical protein